MAAINNIIGPRFDLSVKPKAQKTANENFMDALRDTFAKQTGKLVGTKIPGMRDDGVVFSPNPQNLIQFAKTSIV
ncbi:MAG: hypothetical protein PHG97_02270 [Candidatus Margulisbacteria bacterium]|nr:hypothetical protein [Candidatus Margulisiibacteriota bacterium]